MKVRRLLRQLYVDDRIHGGQVTPDDGVAPIDQELRERLLRLRIVELTNLGTALNISS